MLNAILYIAAVMFTMSAASAQHNHAAGHDEYKDWSSRKVQSCCSDRDCGVLKDEEVRETPTGTQIKIGEDWCPVKPEHYIIKGRSPDWNVSHACISPFSYGYRDQCERLLCYSGRGGF